MGRIDHAESMQCSDLTQIRKTHLGESLEELQKTQKTFQMHFDEINMKSVHKIFLDVLLCEKIHDLVVNLLWHTGDQRYTRELF